MTGELYTVPRWHQLLWPASIVCSLSSFPLLFLIGDWELRAGVEVFLENYGLWLIPLFLLATIFRGLASLCKAGILDHLVEADGGYAIRSSDANKSDLARYHLMVVFAILGYSSIMTMASFSITAVFLLLTYSQ